MAVSDGDLAFVLDQLAGLGDVRAKRMFGGIGLYALVPTRPSGASEVGPLARGAVQPTLGGPAGTAGGRRERFFGLLDDGVVYFKTDDATRARYTRRRMTPFMAPGEQPSKTYYRVPTSILEDADALVVWAREAVAVADRAVRIRPARDRRRRSSWRR
jgi:DNA transformation protein